MANDEGLTVENTEGLKMIGKMTNNWRQRRVEIYQHPIRQDAVVSVGYPFTGGEPVVCVESRSDYRLAIVKFPNTHVFN